MRGWRGILKQAILKAREGVLCLRGSQRRCRMDARKKYKFPRGEHRPAEGNQDLSRKAWWQYQRPAQLPPFRFFGAHYLTPRYIAILLILSKYWKWTVGIFLGDCRCYVNVQSDPQGRVRGLWWPSTRQRVFGGFGGEAEGKCYPGWPRLPSVLCRPETVSCAFCTLVQLRWCQRLTQKERDKNLWLRGGKAFVPRRPPTSVSISSAQ